MATSNNHFPVCYHHVEVDGAIRVFYREAGDTSRPVLLLLHGYPSSSFQFRELIPLLADKFHIVAPDFPGFGFTTVPAERQYVYSFDNMAKTVEAFVDALQLKYYTMYVFDYGAPVGLRLALAHPERVTGFISQNGNAYEEGLGDAWAPIRAYWKDETPENRDVVRKNVLHYEGTRWQYVHGVPDAVLERMAPETFFLDQALMDVGNNKEIQLDLFLDYANNLKLYPQFQQFFRDTQVKSLIIWGKYDPFFTPPGAEAYKRDNKNAEVELLETGHFALETHVEYIAQRIREVFLTK
ncbi:hypothetical protein Poli38472_003902 [Pythium oligandrum]|uniref:AB hydrolase-1 domain-containing protein n=2 Tax=Pythium oligandrum TaxID=41045 RepID=A0A8K1FNR0_PYTOL|nr:hypothetical protein Poli38472_003902 [Pythium oligandrum]|eukprot:TMW66137.1 hypothetical protein Poli38472_003902 [Pythium oligandrum]